MATPSGMMIPQVNTRSMAVNVHTACSAWPAVGLLLRQCGVSSSHSFAGKRNSIMVKMVPMDDHLLLQWMAPKSFKEPRLLDLNVNDYVESPSDTVGDGENASGSLRLL